MTSSLTVGQRVVWTSVPARTGSPLEPLTRHGVLVSVDPDRGQPERWATVRYDDEARDSRVFLDQLTPAS